MYDVIYDYFQHDADFWDQWDVVACAPSVPEASQKQRQERAAIRIVVDKPAGYKLPTTYPPCDTGESEMMRSIPGLPAGFNVPLDAYTFQDGESLLDAQRKFHDGEIQPRYRWLDDIIRRHRQVQEERHLAIHGYSTRSPRGGGVMPRPKAKVTSGAGFVESLKDWGTSIWGGWTTQDGPVDNGEGRPATVEPFSRGTAVSEEEQLNNLVSVYTLPSLSTGPFGNRGYSARPQPANDHPEELEVSGEQLDANLERLLLREQDPEGKGAS